MYGALYVREGTIFDKIQDGGHQEKDKRGGTENVAEIVGLGKAIEIAYKNIDEYNAKLSKLRDYYISSIEKSIPDIIINGDRTNRLPRKCKCFIQRDRWKYSTIKTRCTSEFVYQLAQHAIQEKLHLHMY